jgi:hypothetical protein
VRLGRHDTSAGPGGSETAAAGVNGVIRLSSAWRRPGFKGCVSLAPTQKRRSGISESERRIFFVGVEMAEAFLTS